jgi:hypothetical protein
MPKRLKTDFFFVFSLFAGTKRFYLFLIGNKKEREKKKKKNFSLYKKEFQEKKRRKN